MRFREESKELDAALQACELRLRPTLMTSLAFILGVTPLMYGMGAGYENAVRVWSRGLFRDDRRCALRFFPDAVLLLRYPAILTSNARIE